MVSSHSCPSALSGSALLLLACSTSPNRSQQLFQKNSKNEKYVYCGSEVIIESKKIPIRSKKEERKARIITSTKNCYETHILSDVIPAYLTIKYYLKNKIIWKN
jgi:hypothetical protein